MKNLTANQKEIKEMFDILNTKSISNKKYESLLLEIKYYAESKNEHLFFRDLLLAALSKKN
jgi:hypothetical protein